MNHIILKFLCTLSFAVLFTSCAGEDMDDILEQDFASPSLVANVSYNDLIGTWYLNSLTTDTPVDLNNDQVGNTNLRLETACFDQMSITFTEDEGVKSFSSVNARMDFRAGDENNLFACMQTDGGPDTGTWDINEEGNLVLYMTIDGTTYSHTKELTYNENTFSLEVTRAESQAYVTSDPTGTAAERINVIEVAYQR